jgi:hypothetical protein
MKNNVHNQLSFEPMFHRKISQRKYIPISTNVIKVVNDNLPCEVDAERQKILAQGFIVADSATSLPYATMGIADKGDVASVIAKTNPLFKMHLDKEEA